jgi:hypothetical protein
MLGLKASFVYLQKRQRANIERASERHLEKKNSKIQAVFCKRRSGKRTTANDPNKNHEGRK